MSEAFARMYNLRLLKIYNSRAGDNSKLQLPRGFGSLSDELRYLHWDGYPHRSLPANFDPRNLVDLNLSYSKVKQLWFGVQHFVKLKRIDLSYSQNLRGIPDLSQATNLESVKCEGCASLVEISPSMRYLNKLNLLNLKNCEKLKALPAGMFFDSLQQLNLSGCTNLREFPDVSGKIKSIYLSDTAIQEVPSSIECISGLDWLDLKNCKRLKNLPSSLRRMNALDSLWLSGCSKITKFPELPEKLSVLGLGGTAIEEVPSSIGSLSKLFRLEVTNCRRLKSMPSSIRALRLDYLDISGCPKLESFPELLEIRGGLQVLNVTGTNLKELPSSEDDLRKILMSRESWRSWVEERKSAENTEQTQLLIRSNRGPLYMLIGFLTFILVLFLVSKLFPQAQIWEL